MVDPSSDHSSRTSAETQVEVLPGKHLNDEKAAANQTDAETSHDNDAAPEYATGLRLFLIMLTINMSGLLTALEIGIIATAIPAITDEFHSLDDVGWYGCATFIVTAATSAPWGKVYKYLNVKWVYFASVLIFLVGCIVSAAAQNSIAVIVGRAIQGLGITGTMNGSIIVINYVSHPSKHPQLIGIWMAIFMVSMVLGPIIGGALTTGASWRWCFWINLPLGGPILFLILFFLRIPKHIKPAAATWKEIILQLDIPGFTVLLPSLVSYALALQWGGQSKSWSNGSVIATLVVWIVLALIFVVVEHFEGARAMVPLRLMKPRTTWANVLWCFVANSAFYQTMFYLPIYFQSIHGQSAVTSGVNTLPLLVFFGVGAFLSGTVIGKTRYLQPYQMTSSLLMTAGMALLYTLDIHSSKARYVGAEILFGFGLGFGNQIPTMAVQGLSKPEDVPSSTGIMFMAQSGSAVFFIVAAQSIFANRLLLNLASVAPNLNAMQVLGTGASDIHNVYSGTDLSAITDAYMIGIKDVFACALAGAALSVLLALVIPFKRLPDHKKPKTGEKKEEEVSA